ncbi:MAG: ATP-binding protein, partial [Acidimicrobiia bacterium]|nr:ATP-binding protein [Acidimicrobiia bacterium]
MRIRSKLLLVVALPVIGLLSLSILSWRANARTSINSATYDRIALAKDLEADAAAPRSFIVEAYLTATRLSLATSDAERTSLGVDLSRAEDDFEQSQEQWSRLLSGSDLEEARALLLDDAGSTGREFFRVIREDFRPAIDDGDQEAAQDLVRGELRELYDGHVLAIERLADVTGAYQQAQEEQAASAIARERLVLVGGLLLLLVVVALLSLAVVRNVANGVQSLTARARRSATEDLPNAVERVQNGEDDIELEAVTVDANDELAELADAFSSMQRTAVDLAVDQARLRRNVSDMFVNLGRRNQSLLNRTLAFITELERNERDPQTLDDLFRLDHLATRMRRNAESLLVLAGAESARTWSQPVDIADVVRSSLSEVESYDRIDLGDIEAAKVRGTAVADVAHLVAELIENATVYSPPNTRVNVVGKVAHDGYLISVIDQGIGMAPDDLAEANRRLEDTSRFDDSPSRVLGLFVVARLAARHAIHVRLVESATEGVTAKIRLPHSLLEAARTAPITTPGSDASPFATTTATGPVGPGGNDAPAQAVAEAAADWTSSLAADFAVEDATRQALDAGSALPAPMAPEPLETAHVAWTGAAAPAETAPAFDYDGPTLSPVTSDYDQAPAFEAVAFDADQAPAFEAVTFDADQAPEDGAPGPQTPLDGPNSVTSVIPESWQQAARSWASESDRTAAPEPQSAQLLSDAPAPADLEGGQAPSTDTDA